MAEAQGVLVVKVTPPDFVTSCARIVNDQFEASSRLRTESPDAACATCHWFWIWPWQVWHVTPTLVWRMCGKFT